VELNCQNDELRVFGSGNLKALAGVFDDGYLDTGSAKARSEVCGELRIVFEDEDFGWHARLRQNLSNYGQ
jgi:hypothetical protein